MIRFEGIEEFRQRYGVVALVALAIFIVQLIVLRAPRVLGEPYFIAQNLLSGIGFAYPTISSHNLPVITCYIPPLYVWVCAGIMKIGGGLTGIQIFNLFCLQLGALVVYRFSLNFLSKNLAIVSFVILSLYVPLWILAEAIEPNAFNFLLIVLTVESLYTIYQRPVMKRWIWLGVLTGLQILVRPDMLMGALFCGIWLIAVLRKKVSKIELLKSFALTAAIALAIVLPWTVRNYLVFGKVVLVSANGGYNLWLGNNPSASGVFKMNPWSKETLDEWNVVYTYSLTHDVVDYDALFEKFALEYVITHPLQTLKIDLKKLYYHWWRRTYVGDWSQVNDLMIYFSLASVLLLMFGFYGLFNLKNTTARSLILTFFLYSTAVSVTFFVQSRHRVLKVDPLLIPLAVAGFYTALEQVRGRTRRSKRGLAAVPMIDTTMVEAVRS
jgi:hypothetical protein